MNNYGRKTFYSTGPGLSVRYEEKLRILNKVDTKVKLGTLFVRVSPMKDFYFHFVLFWS
jgi:hypothetical protein